MPSLRQKLLHGARRRWPLALLGVTVAAGSGVAFFRLKSAAEAALPGVLKAKLEAALGRPVSFGALHVWPTAIWVEDLRVSRLPGEKFDPLSAKRLTVGTDLWLLLTARKVEITGVEVDGASLQLASTPPKAGSKPWTHQLLGLGDVGIHRFEVRNSAVRLVSDSGKEEQWNARGLNGTLRIDTDQFHYTARAAALEHPTARLTALNLTGVGDEDGIRITRSQARYAGGSVGATGAVTAAGNGALLTLKAQRIPLQDLSPKLGIPEKWGVSGNVNGEVIVDAKNGALRAVKGTVTLDRGSLRRAEGELPWDAARAEIDWTPEHAALKGLRLTSPGIVLTGDGTVALPEKGPFTEGQFRLNGKVAASRTAAVAKVSEVLAFRQLLDGRWEAGNAGIDFRAWGKVGDLDHASATGHVRVDDLRFRPTAKSGPVMVTRLEGNLERTADRLTLTKLEGRTGTLSLTGDVTVTDDAPGKPGQVQAAATLEVRDLKSFRRAVPDSLVWKWIPVASPNASATVTVSAAGPTAKPQEITTQGKFTVRDFRLSARSPLPNGAVFFIPVRALEGDYEQRGTRLVARNLDVEAQTFTAGGEVTVNMAQAEPTFSADLHLRTDDWRSLPAMPPTVLPELSGGRFEGRIKVAEGYSWHSDAPVSGSFELLDAEYTPGREGAQTLPVRRFAADFRWAKPVLELPRVVVDTPVLSGEAIGAIKPDLKDYRLSLDVTAHTGDLGQLTARFTDEVKLQGGTAMAQFHVDSPVEHLAQASLLGSLHVADTTVAQPLALLARERLEAKTLDLDFARFDEKWRLSRLALKGEGLEATVRGELSEQLVNADVTLRTDRWGAPEGTELPLSGGALALEGRLAGEWDRPKAFQFTGEAQLDGASLHYRSERFAVADGKLTAKAVGSGTLATPREWLQRAEVTLRNATATLPEQGEQRVELASGTVLREGEGFALQDWQLHTPFLQGKGSGHWSEKAHQLTLDLDVTQPAALGIPLPKGVSLRNVHFQGALGGDAKEPFRTLNGTVQARGLQLPESMADGLSVDALTGKVVRDGETYRLTNLKLVSPVVALSGEGDWSKEQHHLRLTASGKQLARLGVTLPEGFAVGSFDLNADLRGTARSPLSQGTGVVTLANGTVPFQPGHPIQISTARAEWSLKDGEVKLPSLALAGPLGKVSGRGEMGKDGLHVSLAGEQLEPRLASWLLPGTFKGGRLGGTLELRGAKDGAIALVNGRFTLTNAVYTVPEKLDLSPLPVQVARLSGNYRWSEGTTRIDDLLLDGDVLDGTGTLVSRSGEAHLVADLTTTDSGRAAGFWPQLAELVKGGKGDGKLDAVFMEGGARGTFALHNTGGTLVLPTAPPEYAQHPIEEASMLVGFAPGQLKLEEIKVRGPKGNADGEFTWTDNGPVFGKGKAWFSKSYTSKLMKPTGFGWLAKLFGVKEIKSDFTLSGTSDKVTLDAAITRSFMWKFAKGKVPKEFQQIAAGKAPLWVKPLEVATATPPATPDSPTSPAAPVTPETVPEPAPVPATPAVPAAPTAPAPPVTAPVPAGSAPEQTIGPAPAPAG